MTETMRQAVISSGRPLNAIARESGVPQAALWRFCHSTKRGISLRMAERLVAYLGLELVPRRSRRGK